MIYKSGIFSIVLCLLSVQVCAEDVVRIQPSQSLDNTSYQYYVDLLQLVLDTTSDEFGPAHIVTLESSLSQSRGFVMLKNKQLDVYWAGTSVERERDYLAVTVPLVGGLLGNRVPVIARNRLSEFAKITTAEELQKMVACQGSQWPDSDILEYNGYRIERVISFSLMYTMLEQQRCDYFPRGINEAFAGVGTQGHEALMVYDNIILRYPLPMYFFVNKHNQPLAKRLTQGLLQLLANGKLGEFIMHHPTTTSIFPLSRFQDSRILLLYNPILPANFFEREYNHWIDFPKE
ncbi:transporter substrate-binding domain-containing protein [Shewanella litoralis]|uniref:transporter substrate-binding domain-containing protein n=1 Tax=Shewanella litoralis TaxID=2282700 RepID=UPI001358BE7E|nr:transporter substrate-binding domain-containing protein [Shewanella litoralis]